MGPDSFLVFLWCHEQIARGGHISMNSNISVRGDRRNRPLWTGMWQQKTNDPCPESPLRVLSDCTRPEGRKATPGSASIARGSYLFKPTPGVEYRLPEVDWILLPGGGGGGPIYGFDTLWSISLYNSDTTSYPFSLRIRCVVVRSSAYVVCFSQGGRVYSSEVHVLHAMESKNARVFNGLGWSTPQPRDPNAL